MGKVSLCMYVFTGANRKITQLYLSSREKHGFFLLDLTEMTEQCSDCMEFAIVTPRPFIARRNGRIVTIAEFYDATYVYKLEPSTVACEWD